MSNDDTSLLFGVIPPFLRKPEQVARWNHETESHTFTLLRKPHNLEELNKYMGGVAIWRDNGTLTYVRPSDSSYSPETDSRDEKSCLSIHFGDEGPWMEIVGTSDSAVAETAAYFMKLQEPTEDNSGLEICDDQNESNAFDFRAASSLCFTRMFEAAPSRMVRLIKITLSAEQSVVLATRPHPTSLGFWYCNFEDGGTAFVDALLRRESPFGSLAFDTSIGMNDENLKRLVKVETIDELTLPLLDDDAELALLPFSAKVDFLDYEIGLSSRSRGNLQPLKIMTNKLSLVVHSTEQPFPTDMMLWFFRCLADLGHFVELKLSFDFSFCDSETPDNVVHALVNAVLANSNLKVLDLSRTYENLDWDWHLVSLFECLKDHKELRTFKVSVHDEDVAFGPDCSYLRHLLSHNRNIMVTDDEGKYYSDGSSIDELYSLNRFYRGSASLVIQPSLERTSLVVTTLMKSASVDFQRSALLLSDHADVLHELLQRAKLDELSDEYSSSQRMESDNRKRKRTMQ